MRVSGVYLIRNSKNGKVYVGSSVNVNSRLTDHRSDLRNGNHHSRHLQRSWDKYDKDVFEFEVIECCVEVVQTDDDMEYLLDREQFYMDECGSYDRSNGYNICPDARGHLVSEETKKLLSKIQTGKPGPEWSEEQRARMSARMSGKNHPFYGKTLSEEHRHNLSKSLSGQSNPFYGETHDEQTRQKISQKVKEWYQTHDNPFLGRTHSEKTKQKMSENHSDVSGTANPNSKLSDTEVKEIRVRYFSEDLTYSDLFNEYGISVGHVGQIICGNCRPDAGGPIKT